MASFQWFALRGEEYMFDEGKWWRTLKGGEEKTAGYQVKSVGWMSGSAVGSKVATVRDLDYRVPCSQPFQVGDRVKVLVKEEWKTWHPKIEDAVREPGEIHAVDSAHGCMVHGYWIPPERLEPAQAEPEQSEPVDPGEGWEIYEPVSNGEPNSLVQYSEGTEWTHRHSPSIWYKDGLCDVSAHNYAYIYRRPKKSADTRGEILGQRVRQVWETWAKEQADCKPHWVTPWSELEERHREVDRRIGNALWGDFIAEHASTLASAMLDDALADSPNSHRHLDIHLPEVERKVLLAAVKKPEVLDWWRGAKLELAIEAGKRIGGAK